jgi:drug/metabolite transporter (DMT)-like permease
MNKWGIIGCLFFVAAVIVAYFLKIESAIVIELGFAAFGLTAIIINAVKNGKAKAKPTWQTIVVIALACVGGVLVCIGGLAQNIFAELSGAVLALLAVIFGLVFNK